jgi:hypothetical protein
VYFALADVLAASPGPLTIGVRTERGRPPEEDVVVVVIEGADPALAPSVLDEAGPLGGTVEVSGDAITARFPCG